MEVSADRIKEVHTFLSESKLNNKTFSGSELFSIVVCPRPLHFLAHVSLVN